MTTNTAKQMAKAVALNVQGVVESAYRVKYVTHFGKTVFRLESTNGRDWLISLNLLEVERFDTVLTQFPGMHKSYE